MRRKKPTLQSVHAELLIAAKAMFEPGAHGFQMLRDAIVKSDALNRRRTNA